MEKRVAMAKEGKELPEDNVEQLPVQEEEPQELPDKLNSLPGRNLLSA